MLCGPGDLNLIPRIYKRVERENLLVLVRVSIAMKSHHDHSNSYTGKSFNWMAYTFRGLVHFHHGSKLGGMQVDIVLDKELRILYLWPTGNSK